MAMNALNQASYRVVTPGDSEGTITVYIAPTERLKWCTMLVLSVLGVIRIMVHAIVTIHVTLVFACFTLSLGLTF